MSNRTEQFSIEELETIAAALHALSWRSPSLEVRLRLEERRRLLEDEFQDAVLGARAERDNAEDAA